VFAHDASSLKCVGKTRIGLARIFRSCFAGAGSAILPSVTVGHGSIVGGDSTVQRNMPVGEA
jgi:acetyltransferase-like isoleucine patch superfamily enzyme